MRVTLKGDVYSFGVVLLEIVSGRRPVVDEMTDLVSWIKDSIRKNQGPDEVLDPRLEELDGPLRREILLVLKIALFCTKEMPEERPTMRNVVEMLRQARDPNTSPSIVRSSLSDFI